MLELAWLVLAQETKCSMFNDIVLVSMKSTTEGDIYITEGPETLTWYFLSAESRVIVTLWDKAPDFMLPHVYRA